MKENKKAIFYSLKISLEKENWSARKHWINSSVRRYRISTWSLWQHASQISWVKSFKNVVPSMSFVLSKQKRYSTMLPWPLQNNSIPAYFLMKQYVILLKMPNKPSNLNMKKLKQINSKCFYKLTISMKICTFPWKFSKAYISATHMNQLFKAKSRVFLIMSRSNMYLAKSRIS